MIRLVSSGAVAIALLLGVGVGQRSGVAQTPASGGPVNAALIEDLVAANRILAEEVRCAYVGLLQ